MCERKLTRCSEEAGKPESGRCVEYNLPGRLLDAIGQRSDLLGMDRGKKKPSGAGQVSKQRPALGLVIVLAAAGGAAIGSAGTYFLTRPQPAPVQSAGSAVGGTSPTPSLPVSLLSTTAAVTPPQQFTPGPQPPGEAPPGKVWSPEHGHWHDAPAAVTIPAPTPGTTPTPAPATATPTPPP